MQRSAARGAGSANQGVPSWLQAGLWLTIPCMSTAIVIEAPLRLEPVSPDSFIADLEPVARDAQARATELVQRAAAVGGRRI
jgi:hypothetical protein